MPYLYYIYRLNSKGIIISKNKINYIINWIAFLLGLTTFATGAMRFSNILTFIIINIGPVNAQLLNLIHRWSGVAAGTILFIHLILHWRWVFKTSKNLLGVKRSE